MDLETCRRIISVFNTAAITILQNEAIDDPPTPYPKRKGLDREAWVKAVVKGADEKSPRWRHLLLLAGVLIGFEGQDRQGLPSRLRSKLESALVNAIQLALNELQNFDGLDTYCITLVLNYTFELLSDSRRSQLDYDHLLPVLVRATYFSEEGLEGGYFISAIDGDVVEVPGKKFKWSEQSPTYIHTTEISNRPLITSLGPLSRLIAHAIENVRDPDLVASAVDSVADFVRTLIVQWRQNKLCEVDISEEAEFFDEESLKRTIPTLWKLFRACMFSVIIVLRAVLGRVLNDPVLAAGRSKSCLDF